MAYLESKHKRDRAGRFSGNISGNKPAKTILQEGIAKRKELRRGATKKLSGNRLDAKSGTNKPKPFVKIGLGNRIITKLEKRSKARAGKRRSGRRTRG